MKKLMMIIGITVCAVVMTGCGNKHVSLAKEFGEVLCSGDGAKVEAFCKKNIDESFEEANKYNRTLKKDIGAFMNANGTVAVKALWKGENDGAKGAIVSLTRGDATLYVVVAEMKGKGAKITSVTGDKKIIDTILSAMK